MTDRIDISVRALAEYAHRSGSIEAGFRTAAALVEGTKAHRAVQETYRETDRKEVYVSGEVEHEGIVFRIDGRCDGLLADEDGAIATVDEIKSTAGDWSAAESEGAPVHWAQAQCYAYLYARAEGLPGMRVRLTYVHRTSGEQRRFERSYALAELEAIVRELVRTYAPFAAVQIRHAKLRDASAKALSFPYADYRQGQRRFAGAVYTAIAERKRLFARAPTGTGKTISTLFPAVKAIGEGVLQRFFYLTAKTTTRAAAEDAFSLMESKGLHLRRVTITAKEAICFKEETRCDKAYCEYADGYYDRINGALLDLLGSEIAITREIAEAYARKHRVCPFEMSLDAAYAADAIVCDYNYVFDPRVSLKRLFEEQKRHAAVLVDEAHNLVDRGRDMFSAELTKAPFVELKRFAKGRNRTLYEAVKAVNDWLIALRKGQGDERVFTSAEAPAELVGLLETFAEEAGRELARSPADETTKLLTDVYYAAQNMIRTSGYYDERFVTYAEFARNDVRLKLFCLDPSMLLRQAVKGYRSLVAFSATLSPLGYYRDMLGGEADDYTMSIPSPFGKEQLEVYVLPLSTRYADRGRSVAPIAAMLHELMGKRPGNTLVFFPSYEYMNAVYEAYEEKPSDVRTLVQRSGMAEEERSAFLEAFREEGEQPVIGFAVMGGVFSEGIDLTGNRLTGVVVVGVGLPQVGLERELIKRQADETGRNGFDYAYRYPGMNKVMQAGGRLIRTESDRGTLVLVDDRFVQPGYRMLLPDEWRSGTVCRTIGEAMFGTTSAEEDGGTGG
ncbi:ATP-dependent DNA helicase [Paenibacillus flagellatus]|uniref:ATP-dependent helicase n=1 Tax=Paenibacillus flagellatus TaxID=2211139 RepID=A0A2V5K0A3_9BACL|nr:ATP-dependent DNA helicase [Paenibacillus flagellatus]PYI52511.1 ATP-dependent helicase [Paenibacillus flagellatus]